MYSSSSRQYLLKQATGQVYNFFYDEKLGLCYSTLTKRNTWTEPVSLQKNLHQNFYADIDSDDAFHILTQDTRGSIFCSELNDGNIKTIPILGSKISSAYNKYLSLVPLRNNINVFYVIEHNDSLILAHQTITAGKASNPRVVDYVFRNSCPYSVICDRAGNIYAFYQSSDGRYLQLGYKKYLPAQKFWSEFTPVTRFKGDSEFPRTIIDDKSIIHLCYQRRGDRQYELVYQQKVPEKNLWSNEVIIHSSAYPFAESSIISINNVLTIFWVREDIIYYSSSSDGGSTWSKPARLTFPAGRQLACISYKSNDPYEREKIVINEIPGCFINGYKLAFYQDVPEMMGSLSPNELRDMIVDTLKLLKGSMEELKESQDELKAVLSGLSASQQDLEKEISKLSIRLNMLEDDMRQIKSSRRRPSKADSPVASKFYKAYPNEMDKSKSEAFPDNIAESINSGSYMEETFLTDENIRKEMQEFKQKLANKSYKLSRKYRNARYKLKRG